MNGKYQIWRGRRGTSAGVGFPPDDGQPTADGGHVRPHAHQLAIETLQWRANLAVLSNLSPWGGSLEMASIPSLPSRNDTLE